jgi:hypothetical protein
MTQASGLSNATTGMRCIRVRFIGTGIASKDGVYRIAADPSNCISYYDWTGTLTFLTWKTIIGSDLLNQGVSFRVAKLRVEFQPLSTSSYGSNTIITRPVRSLDFLKDQAALGPETVITADMFSQGAVAQALLPASTQQIEMNTASNFYALEIKAENFPDLILEISLEYDEPGSIQPGSDGLFDWATNVWNAVKTTSSNVLSAVMKVTDNIAPIMSTAQGFISKSGTVISGISDVVKSLQANVSGTYIRPQEGDANALARIRGFKNLGHSLRNMVGTDYLPNLVAANYVVGAKAYLDAIEMWNTYRDEKQILTLPNQPGLQKVMALGVDKVTVTFSFDSSGAVTATYASSNVQASPRDLCEQDQKPESFAVLPSAK